jgi:acetyl-CoA carboxylase biotin carboxyl carrier protein
MDELVLLKDLIRAFNASSFTQVTVSGEGVRIKLCQRAREDRRPPHVESTATPATHAQESHHPEAPAHDPDKVIESPRVGHFHPIRDAHGELAVKAGDMIEEGQSFAVIESMNLKYEIRSDKSGLVERYLIDDGEAVEYGEPLIQLR